MRFHDILIVSPTPTYPDDQGNRKRIRIICDRLKAEGARIHFLFYPLEWWFTGLPVDWVDGMRRQWDSVHLVPTGEAVHPPPKGEHHEIDEWWDPRLGDYLAWLCRRQRFDAMLVNYAYLSKAFEYAPRGCVKILDTHDRFSGRRELLERNGVAREFFYTTPEHEAVALRRADVVWAIKEEEAEFFRGLAPGVPVMPVPHAEPPLVIPATLPDEPDRPLVVGMIGATNAINVRNARDFLAVALPRWKAAFAPITIRFAGGMCSGLEDLRGSPGIELLGRVSDIADFYAGIDAALVPLTFSTGLKIKAAEAFATGTPIIAHAHAVEGIPVEHPFHACRSLEEVADRCIDLAWDRSLLPALRVESVRVHAAIEAEVASGIRRTIDVIRRQRTIILALNGLFWDKDHLYREHAIQHLHYLGHAGRVVLYFDVVPKVSGAEALERLNHHNTQGPAVINSCGGPLPNLGMPVWSSNLAGLLEGLDDPTVVLLDLPEEVANGALRQSCPVGILARIDTLADFGLASAAALRRLMADGAITPIDGAGCIRHSIPDRSGDRALRVPFLRDVPWQITESLAVGIDLIPDLGRVVASALRDAFAIADPALPVRILGGTSEMDAGAGAPRLTQLSAQRRLIIDCSGGDPRWHWYTELVGRRGGQVETLGLRQLDAGMGSEGLVTADRIDDWCRRAIGPSSTRRMFGEAGWSALRQAIQWRI